jgi:hypothetical protein
MEITRDLVVRAIAGCGLGGEPEADRVWDWLMSDGASERPESYRNRCAPQHLDMSGTALAHHLFFEHGVDEDAIAESAAVLEGKHRDRHARGEAR